MRKVYLQPLRQGDVKLIRMGTDASRGGYFYELINRNYDSVFFIDPVLRRSITHGVAIVDYQCTRSNRVFGRDISYAV